MTDATVLADALVEAGILAWEGQPYGYRYTIHTPDLVLFDSADAAVTDWRVAGKVLESLAIDRPKRDLDHMYYSLRTISAPRAIIEAWFAAQENSDG